MASIEDRMIRIERKFPGAPMSINECLRYFGLLLQVHAGGSGAPETWENIVPEDRQFLEDNGGAFDETIDTLRRIKSRG